MSFTLSTCVLGSFSVVVGSIVLFSVSQASYIAYFVWLILSCHFFDGFVSGCLDWSKLFKLFTLVLVFLVVHDVWVVVNCLHFFALVFTCFRNVFGCVWIV